MNRIDVIGITCFAYHGCLPEEAKIGCEYSVDVSLWTDFSKAAKNDALDETIDYVVVNHIVKEAMQKPQKLIESVGKSVVDALYTAFPSLERASVTIKKINPPINGDVSYVAITIEQ